MPEGEYGGRPRDFQAHGAGRGRPVFRVMKRPRRCGAHETPIFKGILHALVRCTTVGEKDIGSHGERIGESGRREPWAFRRVHKPTPPVYSAVGVATKSHFFTKVFIRHRVYDRAEIDWGRQ